MQVHALIITYLKKQMPMLGKDTRKKDMIKKLDQIFKALQVRRLAATRISSYLVFSLQDQHHIPASDFPDVDTMRRNLERWDFSKFKSYDQKMVEKVGYQ